MNINAREAAHKEESMRQGEIIRAEFAIKQLIKEARTKGKSVGLMFFGSAETLYVKRPGEVIRVRCEVRIKGSRGATHFYAGDIKVSKAKLFGLLLS